MEVKLQATLQMKISVLLKLPLSLSTMTWMYNDREVKFHPF